MMTVLLQMRKPRHRDMKLLARDHTASKERCWRHAEGWALQSRCTLTHYVTYWLSE